MFDIGWGELLVIGVVALIAIAPKELPGVLRAFGQWTGKIRRMASEFQDQFREAMREAEMADIKKQFDDTTSSLAKPFDPVDYFATETKPADTAATQPAEPSAEAAAPASAETRSAASAPAEPSAPPEQPIPAPIEPAPIEHAPVEHEPATPAAPVRGGRPA